MSVAYFTVDGRARPVRRTRDTRRAPNRPPPSPHGRALRMRAQRRPRRAAGDSARPRDAHTMHTAASEAPRAPPTAHMQPSTTKQIVCGTVVPQSRLHTARAGRAELVLHDLWTAATIPRTVHWDRAGECSVHTTESCASPHGICMRVLGEPLGAPLGAAVLHRHSVHSCVLLCEAGCPSLC